MRYRYGQYDGQPFPTPDDLFPSPQIVQFILIHGQKALDAMDKLEGEQERGFVEQMIAAGLLERDEKTGALRLTPKMLQGIEHRALLEIFEGLKHGGTREGHATLPSGRSDERADGSRPYEFGDPLSEIDLHATLRNALRRRMGRPDAPGGPKLLPIALDPGDFELHVTEGQSDTAVCLLLDMSGSMMRYGRFYHAKRLALGLRGLIRRRFPQDTLDFAGFFSTGAVLREAELPLVMPKPITVGDHQVRLRLPLERALREPRRIPQHFTNLQMGLRLGRKLLSRRPAPNKQIFIVTDGQPTAHVETGPDGAEMLHLLYPPSERTALATLQEAALCLQQDIRIATFALVEDYWGMDWVNFVDRLSRLTRGLAYYCAGDDLGSTVIQSYLNGKRRKVFVA